MCAFLPAHTLGVALAKFLHKEKIRRVYYAVKSTVPPPPLAYLVHFPRLAVILSGGDAMWIEQAGRPGLLKIQTGDAVVVPANHWNRPLWTQRSTTLNLMFGRKQLGLSLVAHDGETAGPAAAVKLSLHGATADAPRNIMEAMLGLASSPTRASRPLVLALLHTCHEALGQPVPAPKRRAANLYDNICIHIHEHFQLPVNRDGVADYFGISPNHLSRLFRREGAITFNEYLTYVRMNQAKYLLKQHRQTLDEVAALCGFAEASYFCRVFKKVTRLTPTEYRQSRKTTAG